MPQKNESLQLLVQKRKDMLTEKFDVASSVINKESSYANLQTTEYLIKTMVPLLMKKLNIKPQEYGDKINYGELMDIFKSLLSNLSNYLKEVSTEVNI